MSGSTWGNILKISTWGESHGKAIGVVVDGIPAGLSLDENDIQKYLDRRKPGQSKFTTARNEADAVEILSGVFEGRTTGSPISLLIKNGDHHSADYSNIKDVYRPGHADYTYDMKYGFRDYRGGGRSSGRETAVRVAAGAIAAKLLGEFGISIGAYTRSIGEFEIKKVDMDSVSSNNLYMPDSEVAAKAEEYIESLIKSQDSAGGVVECVVNGLYCGIGDPSFEKLDANLAKAMMSIGATKGFEIGDGFGASKAVGSGNNDEFYSRHGNIRKYTNHSGGVLGGISDGSDVVFRVAFKPTPSISRSQKTVNNMGENMDIIIHGRHDPVIVPRAVVVVECMAALVIADAMLVGATSKLSNLKKIYE